MVLTPLFKLMAEKHASDMFLTAGSPIQIKIQGEVIPVNGQVLVRPMMYVALTYDHRVVDGREAVAFLKVIKGRVEQPARLLLEI